MVIATERFAELARQAGEQSGLREARVVSVAHPIGGVGRAELERRADAVIDEVILRLLGR